jgi:hypothetical protein
LMLLSMAVRAARTTAPACPKNLDFLAYWKNKFLNIKRNQKTSVSDPYSFFTDPDPYSNYGSGSNGPMEYGSNPDPKNC